MPGYPRTVGYYPGTGVYGDYVAGAAMVPFGHMPAPMLPVHPAHGGHPIHSPPWRNMNAPGSPPLGEGHVFMPLNAETFNGTWGAGATPAGAAAGATITFTGRPQKPFKATRVIVRGTKSGATAVGNLIGQVFVGTDLQQGDLGNVDLESIGAATAFDTWVSWKQAEPGVAIKIQATLTAFPTGTDFELYTITVVGHYLH
jgi:hypothetical protein